MGECVCACAGGMHVCRFDAGRGSGLQRGGRLWGVGRAKQWHKDNNVGSSWPVHQASRMPVHPSLCASLQVENDITDYYMAMLWQTGLTLGLAVHSTHPR